MNLFESGSAGERAESDDVKALAVEVRHYVGPECDILEPVVEWGTNSGAVVDEDHAAIVVTAGAEWKVGGDHRVVYDLWWNGRSRRRLVRRRRRRRRRHSDGEGCKRRETGQSVVVTELEGRC